MSLRPVALDELVLTLVVDNETDNLSSIDGLPVLPEVVGLLGRIAPTRQHDGHDCIPVFDHICVACHGLSVLATGTIGDERHSILFDVGPYAEVWLDNAERLAVDLASIEVVFLSHWHWDHSGAMPEVIAAITVARSAMGLAPPIVDVHPDRPDQRGIRMPWGTVVMLPPEPTLESMAAAGGDVRQHRDAHLVGSGYFLGSGPIERVTDYGAGLDGHHSFVGDVGVPDPLILDERYIVADVAGRGITVLSACSHAGIVNACLDARRMVPGRPFDTVLGGYHLAGASMEQRIGATVDDLERLVSPQIVAPGHCTGWRAKAALANRFAPGRYAPALVGMTYHLR